MIELEEKVEPQISCKVRERGREERRVVKLRMRG